MSDIAAPSPVQKVCVDGFEVYVKRDDLLSPQAPALSGNKARKFQFLLAKDCAKYTRMVSFGSAQGNGLVALAAIAKRKGLEFDYYVDHIAGFLKQHPAGNYQAALAFGVNFKEVQLKANGIDKTLEQYVAMRVDEMPDCLYVPEGGAFEHAAVGVYQLADELIAFFDEQQAGEHSTADFKVMLPSGTGTMAWFLQQRFVERNYPIEVWTCACVGSNDYLLNQFKRFALLLRPNFNPPLASSLASTVSVKPKLLNPAKKYHFGKLYPEFWRIWQRVGDQTGIEFELLYDPLGWMCLLSHMETFLTSPLVVYLHQGGVMGNQTMINRYRHKFT